MAATTGQLGLVTPTQGTLSGTWGDTVSNGITEYVNIAIAGTLSFAGDGAITLANTTGSASATNFSSTTAQYMVIRITGTQTVTKVITGPSYSKLYMVDHAGATSAVTFKASGQTGVSVAVGEKCFVYFNGTDYVKVASSVADGVTSVAGTGTVNGITLTGTVTSTGSLTLGGTLSGVSLTSQVSGTLPVANGGTGVTTSTGTGSTVLSDSPTLTSPYLGTPLAGILSACTGLPLSTGVTGILSVAKGGNGSATPNIAAGSNITVSGTWPNQTISANAASTGQYQAVASGSLATGATVVVNSDGTVSAVNSNPVTNGTTTTFTTDQIGLTMAATYDSSNQRVVVAYRDTDVSNLGYAIVGTVSGTTISFGTPVQFVAQAVSSIALTFDSTNNKVVIVYNNTFQSKGYAAVGTVSGTSISFGTAVQVSSGTIGWASAVFDAVNGKVVIAYQSLGSGNAVVATVSGTSISLGTEVTFDASNSWYISAVSVGASKVVIAYSLVSTSQGKAIVGTVSGTSISFGTAVAFVASSNGRYISAAYDTTNTKVVIAYANVNTAPYYGAAIVGTVSGTSISFGTAVQFAASTIVSDVNAAYSPTAGRVLITYSNNSNSYYGTLIVGTVSGTSISFGPSSIFSSTFTSLPVSVYDSTSTKMVLSSVTTGAGQSRVVTIGTSTNLTATNYIGISYGAYNNGDTAVVQVVGSYDSNQTGLTPGLAYYVQTTGALASTAGSPSVFAGTAVSATQILVKG
jgi:hypothetical protein